MKKNKIIFALLLLFFPMYVFAGSFSLSKTSETVQTGESTSFEIRVTNAVGKFQVTTSNSGVASVSINSSEANGDKVWIEETAGGTTRVTVNVTAGSQGGTATITVKPLDVTQYDTGNELTGNKTFTLTVNAPYVASGNNNLSSLSISPGSLSPTFSASTTTYTATVDAGSITINASAADGAASVSGRGGKNLNYGENTFEVVCTAENGSKKTYVLKITRPDNRSSNSFLKSLSVDGMTLNPTFNKNTTSYSLPQVDASSITVNAAAEDSKATVSGAGKRNLDYGDNSIRIEVKAENDSTKVYTINVNRKDNRETVNTLSALSVEGYSISPKFSEGTTDYSLTVPSNVSEVTINATRKSNKSSFVKNYGPRKVNLNYGENKVLIQVQAENTGSDHKAYKVDLLAYLDSTHTEQSSGIDDTDASKLKEVTDIIGR